MEESEETNNNNKPIPRPRNSHKRKLSSKSEEDENHRELRRKKRKLNGDIKQRVQREMNVLQQERDHFEIEMAKILFMLQHVQTPSHKMQEPELNTNDDDDSTVLSVYHQSSIHPINGIHDCDRENKNANAKEDSQDHMCYCMPPQDTQSANADEQMNGNEKWHRFSCRMQLAETETDNDNAFEHVTRHETQELELNTNDDEDSTMLSVDHPSIHSIHNIQNCDGEDSEDYIFMSPQETQPVNGALFHNVEYTQTRKKTSIHSINNEQYYDESSDDTNTVTPTRSKSKSKSRSIRRRRHVPSVVSSQRRRKRKHSVPSTKRVRPKRNKKRKQTMDPADMGCIDLVKYARCAYEQPPLGHQNFNVSTFAKYDLDEDRQSVQYRLIRRPIQALIDAKVTIKPSHIQNNLSIKALWELKKDRLIKKKRGSISHIIAGTGDHKLKHGIKNFSPADLEMIIHPELRTKWVRFKAVS